MSAERRTESPLSLTGPLAGLFVASILVATGSVWAFRPGGGHDFAVFHRAWQLVLEGRGLEIYRVSPDRYLYAPGFAWLLAPVGALGFEPALALWCLAKAAAIGFMVRMLGRFHHQDGISGAGLASWGVVLMARPLLIDFQYGQVNSFIVAACVWGLCRHFSRKEAPIQDFLSWAALAAAALGKIFPLPLLLVPFLRTEGVASGRLARERAGLAAGLGLSVLIPAVSVGMGQLPELMKSWQGALLRRGMPLESHNQSFSALIHHFLSGAPTPVLSMGESGVLRMGAAWLNESTIGMLTLGWSLLWMGLLLGWLLHGSTRDPKKWLAITIGLLIVPSHLIWKPYFVMTIPLATLAIDRGRQGGWGARFLLFAVFAVINFSGFDFVGPHLGAWMEAASVFLLMHLVLVSWAYRP